MRLKEQRLWDRLRNNLSPKIANLQRIENLIGAGFPDVIAVSCGVVTPIELKAIDAMPRQIKTRLLGPLGLSVEQRNWHTNWAKYGGHSIVLLGIGVGSGCRHYAAVGAQADEVNDWTLIDWVQHSLLEANSGPAFWEELTRVLGRSS